VNVNRLINWIIWSVNVSKNTNQITEPVSKLFEGKNFAFVSTLMEDDSPQVTATWIDIEDGTNFVNTAEGRMKHKNISRGIQR